jgi:hypothetical protein
MRSLGHLLLAGLCGLLGVLASGRGSPAGETEDWIRDLLALRAASCPATRTGARCVTSPVVKGGNPAERLELDVTGLDELWLTAQGVPNYNHARTAWCEPELVTPDGKIVRLTELKPFRAEVGWGQLMLNLDHTNAPLKVKDRAFVYGFWAHADSVLAFKLDRQFVAFRCWIGLTGGPGGAARFAARRTGLWAMRVTRRGASRAPGAPAPSCGDAPRWRRCPAPGR